MSKKVIRPGGGKPAPKTDLPSPAVAQFLTTMRKAQRNAARARLIFALDATSSREPTWDIACQYQADMFTSVRQTGGLSLQLAYFRGFGECAASKWVDNGLELAQLMSRIGCRGGITQIGKILAHARKTHNTCPVAGLIYIGDCVEEAPDQLCHLAGELGLLGLPCFMFQEGDDKLAMSTFKEISRLTRGAYFRFSSESARDLAEILKATAIYAAGGRDRLEELQRAGNRGATLLLTSMH